MEWHLGCSSTEERRPNAAVLPGPLTGVGLRGGGISATMKDSGLRRHSTHSIIEGERRVLQSSAPPVLVSTWLGEAEGGESETLPHSPWAQKALVFWEATLLSSFPLLGTS